MILHTVIFTWKPGTTGEQIAALTAAFSAMRGEIDGLIEFRHGSDLALRGGNGDYLLSALFRDEEAWRAYQAHPAHKTVVADHVAPLSGTRVATQIALEIVP